MKAVLAQLVGKDIKILFGNTERQVHLVAAADEVVVLRLDTGRNVTLSPDAVVLLDYPAAS